MTRNSAKQPCAIDLFSGCGGLTLGLKYSGFKVLGAIEIDQLSVETYKANHPKTIVWQDDIRNISITTIKQKLSLKVGSLELLAGCPPCQGFSSLRTLNGKLNIKDPRNSLIWEFLRITKGLKPKAIFFENVPDLANKKIFRDFIIELKKLNYISNFKILDASHFGVPQRRRRLILLAGLNLEIPFPKPKNKLITVEDAIGSLPKAGKSGDPLHDFPEKRSEKIKSLIRKIPKNGGSRNDLPWEDQLECHKKCNGFKDIYGRLKWEEVSPTITTGCFNPSKGRFLHPTENRCITIREATLLQGFPRSYKFPNFKSKIALASLIGNALPPPFIKAHGTIIRKLI